ncbi:MAG: TonB-dependent receptor [Bacteroidia bacterium]|nr:TonB-dependent receptor [Bacteroidia bacterium]
MQKLRHVLLLVILTSLCSYLSAQTKITGKTTAEDGTPLVGASLQIEGTTSGVYSDDQGNFSLSVDNSPPLTLNITYIGYKAQSIEITQSSTTLNIVMVEDITSSEEVVISASRRPEKIQDAPASISVINTENLKISPQIDATRNLVNVPGVQIQQQSANRINIEMRGAAGLFGTGAFPIMDYRSLIGPGIGTFQTDAQGINNIDLQRIEVVRGPGSALYGPGVVTGVIHFITKNPIDFPGTTIELIGGELNTFGGTIRHAGRNASKKFGYKINAHYKRGNEFILDPTIDADQIAKFQTTISQPQITNGVVDVTKPLTTLLTEAELDDDGDGNPMQNDWFNTAVNATLEFRPTEDLSIFTSGGYNQSSSVFYNNQGEGLAQATEFWGQARVQKGGFFGQFFYVDNDGGSQENPTFLYQTGLRTPVARKQVEAQVQYNFETPGFLNAFWTAGADYRQAINGTENLVYGRNEEDDDYQIYGAYLQGKFALGDKLDLTLAGRYDRFNFLDDGAWAPRAALVYKAAPTHTFRATYNRATGPPSGLQVNIDFPVASPVPGLFDIWLYGQKTPHTYTDPVIDITVPGIPDLPFGTPGLPLAIPYGAVSADVLAALGPGLAAQIGQPLTDQILAYLSNPANAPGGVTGVLAGYNIFTQQPLTELVPTAPARLNIIDAIEFGYKGFFGDKLAVTVDVYNMSVKGFTQFTAVAPTYALVLGDTEIQDALANAVATGITPFLVDLFTNAGQTPEQAAATAAGLAPIIGGAYGQGGAGFQTAIAPLLSIFGAVESDNIPQGDGITHVTAGYRSFADAKRDHWGSDIGIQYFVNNDLSFFANYSWLSQNEWIPGNDNDDGLQFPAYLNTPKNKYRFGMNYTPRSGVNGSFAFQHDDSFFANFGQFSGETDVRNLVDASVGYAFDNGLFVSVNATNLFDSNYRAFPNFPMLGRRTLLTLRYTFGEE